MQSGTGTYYDDLHHTADDRKSRQCGYDRGKTRGRLGGNEFSSRQMNMTNTTTKAQVMKVITAAAKTEPKQSGNRSAK